MAKVSRARSIPGRAPAYGSEFVLELYLVFTTLEATRCALITAKCLANDLRMRLVLLVPQVVPYPLPLDESPVSAEFLDNMLRPLASGLESAVEVRRYLCRDRDETVRRAVLPNSIVLIGKTRHWGGWADRRLERKMGLEGHQVILV